MLPLMRCLEEANLSGDLNLSGRSLKEFPLSGNICLTDVVVADLSKNRFTEVPSEVTKFWFIEDLNLSYNMVRSIPDSISGLQSLVYLDLCHNNLSVVPPSLFQLPLQILLLSDNKLPTLPPELGNCKTLMELDISCNIISNLPVQIGKLLSLKSLNIRNNALLEVPLELTSLCLVYLDISQNKIATLPVEIRNLCSLEVLSIADNPLIAPPASVCIRGRMHIFKWLELRQTKEKSRTNDTQLSKPNMQKYSDSWKQSNGKINWDAKKKTFLYPNNNRNDSITESNSSERVYQNSKSSMPVTNRSCSISSTESNEFNNLYESSVGSKNIPHMQSYKEYKNSLKQQRIIDTVYKSKHESDTSDMKLHSPLDMKTRSSPVMKLHSPSDVKLHTPPDKKLQTVPETGLCSPPLQVTSDIKQTNSQEDPQKSMNFNLKLTQNPILNLQNSSGLKYEKVYNTVNWNQPYKPQFTIRREYEKAREEAELLKLLRTNIETYLKMELPKDLSSALSDGVVLCHLVNYIRPHTVSSIHVPSPTVPKLTLARCRKNVDNFIQACRKVGIEENLICSQQDILEGKGMVQVAVTVTELLRAHNSKPSVTD